MDRLDVIATGTRKVEFEMRLGIVIDDVKK